MNASKDENSVSTKLVALNTDGKTVIPVRVSASHKLKVSDGTTGSDHGPKNAERDDNFVPMMMGVSSSDFKTPVVIYGDINGTVLTQTT
jgi:hypothetical protein